MPRSKRTGGPKSPEGKSVTSLNALKTGAYSQTVVLPGENESEFKQLQEQFVHDFSPIDIVESALVRELAVLTWKKLRLEKLEYRVVLARLDADPPGPVFAPEKLITLDKVKRYLPQLHKFKPDQNQRYVEELDFAQKFLKKKNRTEQDILDMKRCKPSLYGELLEWAESSGFDELIPSTILAAQIEKNGVKRHMLDIFFEKTIKSNKEILFIYDNFDKIEAEWRQLKDERLLAFMENPAPSRARDDLSRAFFKTLNELRKHQEWRRGREPVAVQPSQSENGN